jgi:hypothetical protein
MMRFSMTKENDYRQNAADVLLLAQQTSSTSDKRRLLRLAEAWLDLADRARKVAKNLRESMQPPVQQKIDR